MYLRICALMALLLIGGLNSFGQPGVESILTSIKANNLAINANEQWQAARKLQYRTGLNPANPTIGFDYLIGSPANLGNQTDIIVSQSFDFPHVYSKQNKVSAGKIAQLTHESSFLRQEVLLSAKLLCLDLIALNQAIEQAAERAINANRMQEGMDARLAQGDIGLVQANKAKLLAISARARLDRLESERSQTLLKLTELNGGEPVTLEDKEFPSRLVLPHADSLERSVEANDPMLKVFEQEMAVSELQVALTRSLTYPKLETGYHYQAILGQRYSGVHLGMSIPLWENRNAVKGSKAMFLHKGMELEQHRTSHQFEIKALHAKYLSLLIQLKEYEAVMTTTSSAELLQKSLELEDISFLEYTLEMEYYYNALDQHLELQRQLHRTAARLFKHNL